MSPFIGKIRSAPLYCSKTSPLHHKTSPLHHKTSPLHHKTSPLHHKTSPLHHKTSPLHHKTSPLHHKTSPLHLIRMLVCYLNSVVYLFRLQFLSQPTNQRQSSNSWCYLPTFLMVVWLLVLGGLSQAKRQGTRCIR